MTALELELLEALKQAVEADSKWGYFDVAKARAAIARAESAVSEPVAKWWVVVDEDDLPIFITIDRQMAQDHINDTLQEHDYPDAAKWVVRPVYTTPPAAAVSEPVAEVQEVWLDLTKATVIVMNGQSLSRGALLYTTPPAAVPLTPLSDEWIRERCDKTWVFHTVKQWVREVEAAHGIGEKQ